MTDLGGQLPALVPCMDTMPSNQPDQTEQISAERLIERAWAEFNRKTLSYRALFILWGGFASAEELTQRYFVAKDRTELLDKRRRLSSDETEQLEGVRFLAQEVVEYRDWVRSEGGSPMLQDAVVAYCAAFENALKTVVLAFRVAAACNGNTRASFVSADKLVQLRGEVRRSWSDAAKTAVGSGRCTAEHFFVKEVLARNPSLERWPFKPPDDEGSPRLAKYNISPKDYWLVVAEAFKLRNKILHQNGYLDEQVEIAEQVMYAGQDLQLNTRVVQKVHDAFAGLLYPLDPDQL